MRGAPEAREKVPGRHAAGAMSGRSEPRGPMAPETHSLANPTRQPTTIAGSDRRMDAKQVWRAALGELQVSLSPANFETWLRDTQLVDVDEQRFRIAVPNGFAKDWLESRYRSLNSPTLARIVGYSVQVEFVIASSTEAEAATEMNGAAATGPTTTPSTAPASGERQQ